MTASPCFPLRWPPVDADNIQLYSMATPNGQKVGIALEEMELSYDTHLIDISKGDQHDKDFLRINPNGKIPAIIDPHGPEDQSVLMMESIAILIYLADKTGTLLPLNYLARMEHLQWLIFQAAHIGPMFGQFGHFYVYAKDRTTDEYARHRYTKETRRLLRVLDRRLEGQDYLMGEYSIVDIATVPWVDCLDVFYKAADVLGLDDFANVQAWVARVTARPAYQAGRAVCKN
ncbi:MAG: glutathione binding-like protein [Pseudohongiellaceae bacterium]